MACKERVSDVLRIPTAALFHRVVLYCTAVITESLPMPLSRMRRYRYTMGRGLLAVVGAAWLLFGFGPCATAQAHPAQAVKAADAVHCPGCTMPTTSMDDGISSKGTASCLPGGCPSLESVGGRSAGQALAETADMPPLTTAYHPVRAPASAGVTQVGNVRPAGYLPVHPTLRFCVLRI